jgi:hypothetical protein
MIHSIFFRVQCSTTTCTCEFTSKCGTVSRRSYYKVISPFISIPPCNVYTAIVFDVRKSARIDKPTSGFDHLVLIRLSRTFEGG